MTNDAFRLPPVMAHRGGGAKAPENTLAAMRRAAASGVGWVELDVMLTGDGVPVLFHDDSLERITGRDALMAGSRYGELADLDSGSWFDTAFGDERIPSLKTALELFLEIPAPACLSQESVVWLVALPVVSAGHPAAHRK